MKRFHIHLHVDDIGTGVVYYSKPFAVKPRRLEAHHAKWMLEDRRVDLAFSTRNAVPSADYLSLQTDDAQEPFELKVRAEVAGIALLDEGEASCCCVRADEHWTTDPQGLAWQPFQLDSIPRFSESPLPSASEAVSACGTQKAPPGRLVRITGKAASACC